MNPLGKTFRKIFEQPLKTIKPLKNTIDTTLASCVHHGGVAAQDGPFGPEDERVEGFHTAVAVGVAAAVAVVGAAEEVAAVDNLEHNLKEPVEKVNCRKTSQNTKRTKELRNSINARGKSKLIVILRRNEKQNE